MTHRNYTYDVSDCEGSRRVTMIAIQVDGDIDVHNIAVFQRAARI